MRKQNITILLRLLSSCIIAIMLLSNEATAQVAQWSELGGNDALAANYVIISVCTDKSGNIYAAGGFTNGAVNNEGHCYVAKWNGSNWSELGEINDSLFNNEIYTLCSDSAGNIYAAGNFTNDSGSYYVAKFNGTIWSELSGTNALGANGPILSVSIDGTGNIYAGGGFTNSNGNLYVAKWNGSNWSELGGNNSMKGSMGEVNSICSDATGNIYAVGTFVSSNGMVGEVNEWNGSAWSLLAPTPSFLNSIFSVCSDATGNIYVAGAFTVGNLQGQDYYVAKWDGSNWSDLGGSDDLAANNPILSVYSDAEGNIYAAGEFTNGSGKYYVAKWNGSNWSELGGTDALAANGYIQSVCSDAEGNIYAAGVFTNSSEKMYVAKFGGHSTTGIEQLSNTLSSLRLYPNPATNQVTIVSPENIRCIKLLDQRGAVVQLVESLNEEQHILNLSNLAKGTYYLQVNDESALQKIVVQ